jgi:anti-sigma factor RsiW
MKQCWPEGALRAYLDGELPPEEMQSVAAHLGECAACERLHSELSVRSGYIAGLMTSLAEPAPRLARRPASTPARGSWWWTAAAVAVAAGLAIATFVIPRREEPRVPVAVQHAPAPGPRVEQPVEREIQPLPVVSAAARKPLRRAKPQLGAFIALDDEPIESGIVMRVTVPGSTPADIVFSPDGRARAVRLVNGNQRNY